MTPNPKNKATFDWIIAHLSPCPTDKADLTWYVLLDLVYREYYQAMQNLREPALTKVDFVPYCALILGPRSRLGSRHFPKRDYDFRTKKWLDTTLPQWVLEGVRYYRDKIGGELRFGV